MPLITAREPENWKELEETIREILEECGMDTKRGVHLDFPRGGADIDVMAVEVTDGISAITLCECKFWKNKIAQNVVHGFRTVMLEAGAHRGYIISKKGFQSGAILAAHATNIELVTYAEFQNRFFDKWIKKRRWDIENEVGDINVYYEPLGIPGINLVEDEADEARYIAVWKKYLFLGNMLIAFSPYMAQVRDIGVPPLPYDTSKMEGKGIFVPDDVKAAAGYRELLRLLTDYARVALKELRAVNPVTRGKDPEVVGRDD